MRELARRHTEAALKTLSSVMLDKAAPPAARVSAATALLDRGYGKPPQALEQSGTNVEASQPDPMDLVELGRRILFLIAYAEHHQSDEEEQLGVMNLRLQGPHGVRS